jgi:hypothetical protein
MSTEAVRGGAEIIRGFANGQAGGRIAGRFEERKRRTPLSIRPWPFRLPLSPPRRLRHLRYWGTASGFVKVFAFAGVLATWP